MTYYSFSVGFRGALKRHRCFEKGMDRSAPNLVGTCTIINTQQVLKEFRYLALF